MQYEFCVIGGGIVGLATALELLKSRSGASVVVLEKEETPAAHQTGHNSGVIHSGIYYAPGSLKARMCRDGAAATKAFAAEHDIPFEECGKLIVATTPQEVSRLDALYARGRENALDIARLSASELRAAEPEVSGLAAVHVPMAGIIDYREVCRRMVAEIERLGGELRLGTEVETIRETPVAVEIGIRDGIIRADRLVACAGLQSDRLARKAGIRIDHRIVPFRGEYYALAPGVASQVKHLIYPVPDPSVPFLGIHLTRMIDGGTTVGPNAMLGFAREGYANWSANLADIASMAAYPGFWRAMGANLRHARTELCNSLFVNAYLRECRKYFPALTREHLRPYPAGIRAQAVRSDGSMVHDFLFHATERMLHVCNAPSPAATSAIPIARTIAARVLADRREDAAAE